MTLLSRRLVSGLLCMAILLLAIEAASAQTRSPAARRIRANNDRAKAAAPTSDDNEEAAEDEASADEKSDDDASPDDPSTDDEESATESRSRKRKPSNKRAKPDDIGPTSESPSLAMEVRDNEESRRLREHGEESCVEAEERLVKFEKLLTSNQGNMIEPEELGTTLIPVMHVDRSARRLALLGEPSGWDLGARHAELLQRLRIVVEEWRRLPGVMQSLSNTTPLQRVATKGKLRLTQVDQLSRKGKFDAAETLMDEILDDVHSVGILYPGEVSTPILSDINAANTTAQAVFLRYRAQQALSEMSRERERRSPDFEKLLKELHAATAAIAAGQDPQVGSRKLTGPEFLDHFRERWQHEYFEAQHCFGLEMSAATLGSIEKAGPVNDIAGDYDQFVADALRGIAELIFADARRTSAEDAPAVYTAYLKSIAKIAALGEFALIERNVTPALDALVVKSPQLQADASAYYTFSTDLLRWRQRVADGYVAAKMQRYQGVNGAFYQAVPDAREGNSLFDTNSLGNSLKLSTHAPAALQVISPAILTKKVFADGGLSSRNENRRITGYEQGSVYASIPHDVDLSPVVAELQSVLLVGETLPPLTLDAALAMETATQGDLWQFGGEVSDVELEGRITKFANAGPDNWGLFYLTMPISRDPGGYTLQHVIAHCHLRPDWLRHRYFFVEVN